MQEVIEFLINNEGVLQQVKDGTASLVGVNEEEVKAVLEVFGEGTIAPTASYWK